jgi:Protein of unknown function (DUF1549)/Protein of unknown function (DUF1553)
MSRRLAALAFLVAAPCAIFADEPARPATAKGGIPQVVDDHIHRAQREAKLRAAPLADDAAVLRRLTLDLNGRIPTFSETTEYLANTDPQKKTQLVDRLMASPAFVRHQAQEFASFLAVQDVGRRGSNKGQLLDYLRVSFADNKSWDRMFRELMLPDESDTKQKGAGEFLKSRVKDLNRLTIDVSTIFFGVNVSCAQCHDHPHVEAWTQDHFYGMKTFLARTVDNGGFVAERDFGLVKYIPNKGPEKVAPVMFLTGKTIDAPGLKEPSREEKKKEQDRLDTAKRSKKPAAPPEFSLRAKLVETALEPDQRDFFAKAIVNRVWRRFFGRGLVTPLDQMHTANRPSHPELLDWLARDLVEHGYDLRRLIRGLALSDAYARSSRWDGDDAPQERYFAVAQVRALTPMQMAVSLKLATTDPSLLPAARPELEKRLEALERAAERLAVHFPQPGDNFQVGVAEAMLFANNEKLMAELLDGPGTLSTKMKELPDLEKRAELAVRTVLNRAPRAEEIQTLTEYMRRRTDRADAACRQVVWALLTSAEFRFSH